jgi:energy-coupling factor transport system substrate-specific component
MKKIWAFEVNGHNVTLVVTMAMLNIVLTHFANFFQLPLWLDQVGTIIAAMLTGPIGGAFAAMPTYSLFGFVYSNWNIYSITCVFIGILVGMLTRMYGLGNWKKAAFIAFAVILVDSLFSVCFDLFIFEDFMDTTMCLYGKDSIVFKIYWFSTKMTCCQWMGILATEFLIDIPDKILSVIIAYHVYHSNKYCYNND